jgi:hypothetical protein
MDNLGAILIGIASLFSIGVVFSVAARVFSGHLVPLPVQQLIEAQRAHIDLLETQNEALIKERVYEKDQLREMVKAGTEANFAVHQFLARYEALGGFAADHPHRRRPPVHDEEQG